jgi:hypothetical protein
MLESYWRLHWQRSIYNHQLIKEKARIYLRCRISSAINTKIIFSALVLYTGHLMIESSRSWHAFPSYLLIIKTDPIELSKNLLTIINSSVNQIVFSVKSSSMVLSYFDSRAWYLDNFPFIFFYIKYRDVSVEAAILKFLFILWNTSKQDHLLSGLCHSQSMPISWHRQIFWNWSNFNPLTFLILIKVGL